MSQFIQEVYDAMVYWVVDTALACLVLNALASAIDPATVVGIIAAIVVRGWLANLE